MMSAHDAALSNFSSDEDPVLDVAGSLEARLATTAAEVEAAQRLRYEVFYREMSAKPSPEMQAQDRDFDQRPDYWMFYEDGRLIRTDEDSNRDGRVDTRVAFRRNPEPATLARAPALDPQSRRHAPAPGRHSPGFRWTARDRHVMLAPPGETSELWAWRCR